MRPGCTASEPILGRGKNCSRYGCLYRKLPLTAWRVQVFNTSVPTRDSLLWWQPCRLQSLRLTTPKESVLRGERSFQGGCRFARATTGVRVRIIARLVPSDARIACESIHRDAICSPARLQVPMRLDELSWIVVVAKILREGGAAHADLKVLPNLQMEVGVIKSVRIPHSRDLLAARDRLAAMHEHAVEVTIECIHRFDCSTFTITMTHDQNVAPSHVAIACENDEPIGH